MAIRTAGPGLPVIPAAGLVAAGRPYAVTVR